ncbi:sigma factor-like helix-turn-helix DNA-binding protein [Saccharibacillus brassicae]|uniref:RNA polymerase sigma factor 70 region 4 type 2 domain-containing protein n=1 Tax=Saccharibacillus brassicae TaxID=2583377 RepID=A0A4Y6V4G2_SACBS|nr:sigma factor-like helix-turn-helix DNA-binding protein [Saccharibacillus brassicae]QDH23466.1 hypothetical protein FFV09_22935 [Saccharibacillus brassicae]
MLTQETYEEVSFNVNDLGGATALTYRKTRLAAQRSYNNTKESADSLKDKLIQTKDAKSALKLQTQIDALESEKKVLGEIISDCEFVEEWIVTGRRPGGKRGIERRAAYEREKLMDPTHMQSFVHPEGCGSPSTIGDTERERIEAAMKTLSKRERECYTLAHGECYSLSEIGKLLFISKASVQVHVRNAQRKISKYVQSQEGLV